MSISVSLQLTVTEIQLTETSNDPEEVFDFTESFLPWYRMMTSQRYGGVPKTGPLTLPSSDLGTSRVPDGWPFDDDPPLTPCSLTNPSSTVRNWPYPAGPETRPTRLSTASDRNARLPTMSDPPCVSITTVRSKRDQPLRWRSLMHFLDLRIGLGSLALYGSRSGCFCCLLAAIWL